MYCIRVWTIFISVPITYIRLQIFKADADLSRRVRHYQEDINSYGERVLQTFNTIMESDLPNVENLYFRKDKITEK